MSQASMFITDAKRFLRKVNSHPDNVALYGNKLIKLGSKLGILGVKAVTKNHLIVLKRSDNFEDNLVKVNRPYRPVPMMFPGGQYRIRLIPPKPKSSIKTSKPKLHDVHNCFYDLLAVAIRVKWTDHSNVTFAKAKEVLTLNGLRFSDTDRLRAELTQLKTKSAQLGDDTSSKVQSLIFSIPNIMNKGHNRNHDKFVALTKVLNALDEVYQRSLSITPKASYLETLKELAPQMLNKHSSELEKLSNDDFIVANDNTYKWRKVTGNDMAKEINELLYFLQ